MCQLPIGIVLDRFGVTRVGRLSTFVWSVASFAAAASPSVFALFAARFLLGVGEAPTFPANAKAIGQWFPTGERGLATAIFDAAAKFASALGVPVLGLILLKIGWRSSFAITGLISLIYFFIFWRIYRDPPEDPGPADNEKPRLQAETAIAGAEPSSHRASLGYLIRQPKVLGLALGFGSYNYVFYLLLTWLPSYLSSALHLDLLHSFLYTGVPWLFATAMGFGGGATADALIRRGWNPSAVRKSILVCGMILGLGIVGAANTHSAIHALVWITISIGGLSAAAPVGWSVPSLIAPRHSVGTVGGIVNFSNQLSGISAPIITGYVVSITHSYFWVFTVASLYLLVGIAGYVLLLGRIEPIAPDPASLLPA